MPIAYCDICSSIIDVEKENHSRIADSISGDVFYFCVDCTIEETLEDSLLGLEFY
jgi:hypothetical protein